MRYYQIRESSAAMPSSCWGRYVHVAVVEVVSPDHIPHEISTRDSAVVRVVREWSRCHDGTTERSASGRAWTEARELLATLERQALVEQAIRYGGTIDGADLLIETMRGTERLPLADVAEALVAARQSLAAAQARVAA